MNYPKRVDKLHEIISSHSCDALLIDDLTNLYYLTGLNLSAGRLLLHPQGITLFVDSRYYELCKEKSPFPVQLAANGSFSDFFNVAELQSVKSLAFDSSSTPYQQYLDWQKRLAQTNKAIQLIPLDNPCKPLRRIKDAEEISLLRKAAHLGSEGYDFLCQSLQEGVSEIDLAIELEIFWKRKGSKGLAFDPIIAFGPNSSMPHYRAGSTKLKKGNTVLFDIGVNLQHYHSDMTRVLFYGEPQPQLTDIYSIVLESQERALALCKPGTLIGDLDSAARGFITSKGYGENFSHSLGHGVGLHIHESPALSQKSPDKALSLEQGMVITIEPGIYLPGIGGVRIEDTIAITATGYENLTNRNKKMIVIN